MADVVWLASYPKSGNTWMRALLEGFVGEGAFDLDNLGAGVRLGGLRSLDGLLGVDPSLLRFEELVAHRPHAARLLARDVAARESPAVVKVHSANHPTASGELAFPPDAGRAVYVARNPLDVAASMAPFFDWPVDRVVATMADTGWVLNHRPGRFMTVVPERMLSWSGHVRSWLDAPGVAVHLVRYEDLLADTEGTFASALRAMDVDPEPDRVAEAVQAARFETLQAQEAETGFQEHAVMATAPFFRTGTSGSWREELSPAQARRVVADHRATMLRLGYADAVAEVEAL